MKGIVEDIGLVYFVRAMPDGLVKIGWAKDIEERVKSLQTGCPNPLKILAKKPGGRREESALHRKFSSQRVRGEWFDLTDRQVFDEAEKAPPKAGARPKRVVTMETFVAIRTDRVIDGVLQMFARKFLGRNIKSPKEDDEIMGFHRWYLSKNKDSEQLAAAFKFLEESFEAIRATKENAESRYEEYCSRCEREIKAWDRVDRTRRLWMISQRKVRNLSEIPD